MHVNLIGVLFFDSQSQSHHHQNERWLVPFRGASALLYHSSRRIGACHSHHAMPLLCTIAALTLFTSVRLADRVSSGIGPENRGPI